MKTLNCAQCDWTTDAPTHNAAMAASDVHWSQTGHTQFFRKGDEIQSTEGGGPDEVGVPDTRGADRPLTSGAHGLLDRDRTAEVDPDEWKGRLFR